MHKRQTPRGPDDLKCPLWKKSMDQVCHTCPWWQRVDGKDPQSVNHIDIWNCSLAFLPLLLIENSQRQMQTAASVDKVANEMQKTDQQAAATIATLVTTLNRVMDVPRQIGNGAPPTHLIEQH